MPFSLANHLLSHDCSSVTRLGWSGTKNGELLRRAEENGFDVLLTLDDNIPSEQNMTGRRISILILKPASQGKASVVAPCGQVEKCIASLVPGTIVRVAPEG